MASASGGGEGLPGFGRWLVRERELRGLDRAEVARATKLAAGVVEALESGEEGRMPPRAYVVGYLRAYAVAAGLDPDQVVLRFQEAAGPQGDQRGRGRGAGSRRAVVWLVIAAAMVAAGVAVLLG